MLHLHVLDSRRPPTCPWTQNKESCKALRQSLNSLCQIRLNQGHAHVITHAFAGRHEGRLAVRSVTDIANHIEILRQ